GVGAVGGRVGGGGSRGAAEGVLRVAASVARKVFQSLWDRNLYVGGAMNMLDQPEFAIGTMRALLKTFEEKRQLIELLTSRAQTSGEVQGVIGSEMPYPEMQENNPGAAPHHFPEPAPRRRRGRW